MGLIRTLRSYLWIPISQDAERRISIEFFDHLLNLDLSFHLKRKTGALSHNSALGWLLPLSASSCYGWVYFRLYLRWNARLLWNLLHYMV